MDPITLSAGAIFSAIGTTFKLAEFCLALKEVSAEFRIFLTLIQRVRKDLEEALRERHEKSATLRNMPGKKAWIDDTILDIKGVLNDIGLLVENARIDTEKGKSVTLYHRFEWVLDNKQKFVMREKALGTCHASLLSAIQTMHTLPITPAALSPPATEPWASSVPALAWGSTTSLSTTATLSPPFQYQYGNTSVSSLTAMEEPLLKSPSRRRPKATKTTSTPAPESHVAESPYEHNPGLRHHPSNSSIQESLLDFRSFSDTASPQPPSFESTATNNSTSLPPGDPTSQHARSHSNSVPDITYHHHDSISSISSDGRKQSFPYFDPTAFELEAPAVPPKIPNDYEGISLLERRAQDPPSYFQEPPANGYGLNTGTLAEGGRTLSNAQERRRRARARFETG